MALKSVNVPAQFEPIFAAAEQRVSEFFSSLTMNPQVGTIEIQGERYVLVRAASLSVHFLNFISQMYPNLDEQESFQAASKILYDMAKVFGRSDAISFHKATHLSDPIQKLSTGPIHFSHTGWAYVKISAKSCPTPDLNYYLLYDHPQSFEADSWIKSGLKTEECVCHMNAGYSTGWCEESFGLTLAAREIYCRAKGDPYCRFIMAHPNRLEEFTFKYQETPEF